MAYLGEDQMREHAELTPCGHVRREWTTRMDIEMHPRGSEAPQRAREWAPRPCGAW